MLELSQKGMIQEFRKTAATFDDLRYESNNTQFSIVDIWASACSVAFMQSPSFLAHQRVMQTKWGKNNARSLYGITHIPTDDTIRNVLKQASKNDEEKLDQFFLTLLFAFEQEGHLKDFQIPELANTLVVALDGTDTFFSNTINCTGCLTTTHSTGIKDYHHKLIAPMIDSPYQKGHVFPLCGEIIQNSDGTKKQDCEINGAKRNIAKYKKWYQSHKVTFTMDDLYSHEPFMREILAMGCHYVSVCKEESHKTIYEWIQGIKQYYNHAYIEGGKRYEVEYVYAEAIPIKDGKEPLLVNFFDVTIYLAKEKKKVYHNAFITDYAVTPESLKVLTAVGRAKWRGENEGHNILKNHGYNLTHNFGHGERLSTIMVKLILLSFLMHTILFFTDHTYAEIVIKLESKQIFFKDINTLAKYFPFGDFQELITFMVKTLNEELTKEEYIALLAKMMEHEHSPPKEKKGGKK